MIHISIVTDFSITSKCYYHYQSLTELLVWLQSFVILVTFHCIAFFYSADSKKVQKICAWVLDGEVVVGSDVGSQVKKRGSRRNTVKRIYGD